MSRVRRGEDGTEILIVGAYAVFDDMTWPFPGERLGEVQRTLRYGEPTGSDLLIAASVLSAFSELVRCPQSKREVVVRRLREALRAAEAHP